MSMTEELCAETRALVAKHGTVTKASDASGINRNTLQSRWAKARKQVPAVAAPVPVPEPADPIEIRRANATVTFLRNRLAATEKVLIATQDNLRTMEVLHATGPGEPIVWLKTPHIQTAAPMTPILFTSDMHVGEVVKSDQLDGMNEYNMDVFCERYQKMIDKTIRLADSGTAATEFPGIIYMRGGDALSGEIHQELRETNDLSAIPAIHLCFRQEREGILRLLGKYGRVRVISIPGNHGRTTLKPHANGYVERNFETTLAWWLASAFESNPNVTFWTPMSGDALFEVEGWQFLCTHGDRMGSRGGQGFIGPVATISRGHQKLIHNYTQTGQHVDFIMTAHMHTKCYLQLGIGNGALVGYNAYARDIRALPDPASQTLLFVDRKHKIAHYYPLRLSDPPTRAMTSAAMSWASD